MRVMVAALLGAIGTACLTILALDGLFIRHLSNEDDFDPGDEPNDSFLPAPTQEIL